MKLKLIWQAIEIGISLALLCSQASGQNFVISDSDDQENSQQYLSVAETCRKDLAVFWTGEPLPGDWSRPCAIEVDRKEINGGGGATSFGMDRGEVFGWKMRLLGNRQVVLRSVLPHEVNHTVLYSLLRRKIPRWSDEGAAALFEAAEEHHWHRKTARRLMDHSGCVFRHFDDYEYPRGGTTSVNALYTTGFTLVEWMLEQRGRRELFRFLKDDRKPSKKFAAYYDLSPSEAWRRWRLWLRERPSDCSGADCYLHGHTSLRPGFRSGSNKRDLFVFLSSGGLCLPCRIFSGDWNRNEDFRRRLSRSFDIRFFDVSQHPEAARRYRVRSVPAFVFPASGRRLQGYRGRDWLLSQLDAVVATLPNEEPAKEGPKTRVIPKEEIGDQESDEKGDEKNEAEEVEPNEKGEGDAGPAPPDESGDTTNRQREASGGIFSLLVSILAPQTPWAAILSTLGIGGPVGAAGAYLIPKLWRWIRRLRNNRDGPEVPSEPFCGRSRHTNGGMCPMPC